jgi:probable rRNA maturation factor
MHPFVLSHTTRSYPRLPYERIKNDLLGPDYRLSLVFVGATRAKELNQSTRGKDYVPNVLSFPLSKHSGEIYITPAVAAREAPKYNLTPRGYVGFLYIHGLLHLKGYDHGPKMEQTEQKYLKKYQLG